jgi:hypothetical protein
MLTVEVYVSSVVIFTVLIATIITLTGFANFGIAQGQVNDSTSSSTLTPQQREAICDPNNPSSELCQYN